MKKRKVMLSVMLAVFMLILAACGKAANENTAGDVTNGNADTASTAKNDETQAEEPMKIVLSHQPYSHGLPSYIGDIEGMFEEAGIDVEILMFTSGPAQNEALGADEWDVGAMGSPPSIMGAIAYDSKVIAFSAPDTEAVSIWARDDSEIAKFSGKVDGYPEILGDAGSWKGKTILCPTSTSAHFTLMATLEKMGLTDSDVEIIDMAVPQAYTAFKSGQGDIVCLWDPQGFYAEEEDWTCISSGKATGEVMPTVVVASAKAIAEKPEVIEAWLDVYLQASEKYSDKLDEQAQLLLDFGLENGLDLDYDTAYKSAAKRPLPSLDDEIRMFSGNYGEREVDLAMEKVIDFFVAQGKIEESDKQALIDNGFIDGQFIDRLAKKYGK